MLRAERPEQCDELLVAAIARGDVAGAVSLYEPAASFVIDTGEVVVGHDAIRRIMEGYLAAGARFVLEEVKAMYAGDGDLALTRARWRASGTGPDGHPFSAQGQSVEVVRRQPDGRWLFVIDCPRDENWQGMTPSPA